jgi:hypothetical protein
MIKTPKTGRECPVINTGEIRLQVPWRDHSRSEFCETGTQCAFGRSMSVVAIYQQSELPKVAFGMSWWDN